MSEGIHTGAIYEDVFYQCKSCRFYVFCPVMPGSKEMEKVKKDGDCSSYKFSSTTRYRSNFK